MASVTIAQTWRATRDHSRIISALMMRELATRYGRDNLGFLWLVGEPLVFCAGAFTMWHFIRPAFEHGLALLPFIMTGYLPITLLRHMANHGVHCVQSNAGLLYHRRINILHLFVSRLGLEFFGVTLAFIVVYAVEITYGMTDPPKILGLIYLGWFLLGVIGFAMGMIFGALAVYVDFIDKFIMVMTYVLMPLSGTFYRAAWLPKKFRDALLTMPFMHCNEMIRAGVFGEFQKSYYNVPFVMAWAAGLLFLGLLLTRFVRERVEVD